MKRSKRKWTILAFSVGACLFVSTAFADALLGSGYDRFKDSVKHTAEQMETGLDNYTAETLFTLKDNGRTIAQTSTSEKMDNVRRVSENVSVTQYANGESSEFYSYNDEKQSVWKSGSDNKYYVTERGDEGRPNHYLFNNPFKEPGAREMEKIVDALVGNLKEYVQAEERPEGGKAYSGSLTETQVPALVNAVSSFAMKQMIRDQRRYGDENLKLEEIESDIFIKKVTGTAIENANGILEHVEGNIVMSGKDKRGEERELAIQIVFHLTDIGSTKIQPPNLAKENVEKVLPYGGMGEKHVGTYKNNIVIEKDGQFMKIGERTLTIESVDNGQVSGTFAETVNPGFEADYPDPLQFSFQYKQSGSTPFFTYVDSNGKKQNGRIDAHEAGRVYVELGIEVIDEHSWRSDHRPYYDPYFNRAFED